MKKKVVTLLFACVLASASMSACGNQELTETVENENGDVAIEEETTDVDEVTDIETEYEIVRVDKLGDGCCWVWAYEIGEVLMRVDGTYICNIIDDTCVVGEIANGITYYTTVETGTSENDYKRVLHVLDTNGNEVYVDDDINDVNCDEDGNIIYVKKETNSPSESAKVYLLRNDMQTIDTIDTVLTDYEMDYQLYWDGGEIIKIADGIYYQNFRYHNFNTNTSFLYENGWNDYDDDFLYYGCFMRIDRKSLATISCAEELDEILRTSQRSIFYSPYLPDNYYVGPYQGDGPICVLTLNGDMVYNFDEDMEDIYAVGSAVFTGEYFGVTFENEEDGTCYIVIYDADFNKIHNPILIETNAESYGHSIIPIGKKHFLVDNTIVGIDGEILRPTDDKSSVANEYVHKFSVTLEDGYFLLWTELYDVHGNRVEKVLKR